MLNTFVNNFFGKVIDFFRICGILEIEKGATGRRLALKVQTMRSPYLSGCRRSLLFSHKKQANNTNDKNTELNQFGISNHWAAPLS